jgi:hypothetical protein
MAIDDDLAAIGKLDFEHAALTIAKSRSAPLAPAASILLQRRGGQVEFAIIHPVLPFSNFSRYLPMRQHLALASCWQWPRSAPAAPAAH